MILNCFFIYIDFNGWNGSKIILKTYMRINIIMNTINRMLFQFIMYTYNIDEKFLLEEMNEYGKIMIKKGNILICMK